MPDDPDVLRALLEDGKIAFAVRGTDGRLRLASRAFREATGAEAGAAAPAGLEEGAVLRFGERQFEVWTSPLAAGVLVGLRDRTELVALEDQIWDQQARLSKAYAELSVRNEKLREHEAQLHEANRGLEAKVQEQLGLLDRSNRLMRYLSPEIANSILRGEAPDLAPKKRLITVLYADLARFDELVAELESEEVIELLNDYRRETTAIIFANGGTLDKFITARILAFFGDPVPQEDHAARAVRTALQLRDKVRQSRRRWFPAATHVDVQIGVHTGYATVGNVGSEHRVDYTVIGKNVALADALQREAAPGHVLASVRTWEIVKEQFEGTEVQVALKGSSRPVPAYQLQGVRGLPSVSGDQETLVAGSPTAAPAAGRRLGPYVVQEKVGQGGMGTVYKALDERLQRAVAVKVLSPELSADAKFVSRFKREAQALAALNSPHIAQIYFISDKETPPFFAMEFVEGGTLRKLLADQGRLPLGRALALGGQIARGLQTAAEKGIVHRDVKPENVMLTPKGQVKITDFGLFKGQDPGLTSQGIVMGTPLYMSPEQARGEEVDFRSDIYSLGATLFHMLVGHPPFRGESALAVMRKHEEEDLPVVSSLGPNLSPAVYGVLQKMMAKDKEGRFASYEMLLEALEGC
ncbi:MAG: protein kinase [Planctomycetes bacterium]|nr:protein kinase [Planctomycetota bacterium]